jgi:hypothetical protein
MRTAAVAVAAFALAPPLALAQVLIPSPRPITGGQQELPPVGVEGHYGPAEPEDLDQIAYNGASYQKKNVIVKGRLDHLVPGRYLALSDGAARVMLIPFHDSDYHDLSAFVGVEVEVTGIVRRVPAQQKLKRCYGENLPESKCEDYLLPVLPDAQPGWPEQSITLLKISDRGKGLARREGRTLADTGLAAAAADGKPVRAIGQFRGANLCGDLAAGTRRDPADWVLLTAEGPVWVVGRRPAGRGFQLDPAYRGDSSRWLEVSGKVEIAGDVRYLKASKVALIPRPAESEPVACPP